MLANPYALLGALLGAIAIFLSGISIGYKWESRAHAADVAAAQVEAIAKANRDTEAAVARTVAQAKAEADARVRAAGIRRKGEVDAIAKARPECARDDQSHRLLVDAIADANGQSTTTSSVPDPVQPTPDTNRR